MSIYFIYERLDNSNDLNNITEFKIGESKDPVARCKNLQTGNKRKLEIYKTIFCATKQAAQVLEATIHERYNARRVHGEWFRITAVEIDNLCDEIQQLREAEHNAAHQRYLANI